MNNNQSWFKRFFLALGRLINISRKIIVNFVFFTVFFIFIIALNSGDELLIVPDGAALVLNLRGELVEQKRNIDPVDTLFIEALGEEEENPEILISELLTTIDKAKNDDRISILVLQLQGLHNAGLSKLQDVGAALTQFKSSGKHIIALGDFYSQTQYYLASHANDIWLNPKGGIMLDGYGRYGMYFKSALEKLEISQHIFRVGTFKSAVEPYMRDNMSEEAKEANKLWLDDLWQQYKTDVASQRSFEISNFDETTKSIVEKLTAANGNFAEYALANSWVDELKNRDAMRSSLIDLVGANEDGDSYKHISYKDYLTATNSPYNIPSQKEKVGIIVAKGTILDGNQSPGTIGGDSTAKLLREARLNDNIKAVVLRVDSPGGSAYASEIIRQEMELLKTSGKPVVASMGTYAASGGYWISAPADKIYASPSTITGSIGIFGMFMTFENTLSKLGIYTDGVGTTELAGFSPTRPLDDGMAELIQLNINRGYQDFIRLVAENRNMTTEQVDAIAQGRVWSGIRAKELGLVDELGNLQDAINSAAALANLDNFDTTIVEEKPNPRDLFLQNLLGGSSKLGFALFGNHLEKNMIEAQLKKGPVETFITEIKNELDIINQFNDPQGIYTYCTSCSE